ncbi:hypothetical protein FCJ61_13490 [Burkholderia metallica]|uniref:RNA polymerase sigma factor region1.1 domain-containing protein n=1 Tax=Burkholderia metallica TaxID=488729 RepID=UPI00157AFD5F|nr:RNA polymerase sigma factor region1.1 domain-containing protein [Burkholderia metallica]NTZ83983.1 hypothetical protein [Burkholderia metallica]
MRSSLDAGPARERDRASRRGADAERAVHLHALIALGIDRGYVTHGEIADALPDEAAERADVDAAASMLRELGIDVRERAGARTAWTLDRHFSQVSEVASPLAADGEYSLREIGRRQLNLSAERVRQLEVAALERIRPFRHAPALRSLLA